MAKQKEGNFGIKVLMICGIIAVVLIIQTILYVICGINKSYIHMDEAYSIGLTNYDKIDITQNEDFYNNWHNQQYYEDYISN